jgi:hypothetical protein
VRELPKALIVAPCMQPCHPAVYLRIAAHPTEVEIGALVLETGWQRDAEHLALPLPLPFSRPHCEYMHATRTHAPNPTTRDTHAVPWCEQAHRCIPTACPPPPPPHRPAADGSTLLLWMPREFWLLPWLEPHIKAQAAGQELTGEARASAFNGLVHARFRWVAEASQLFARSHATLRMLPRS